MAMSLRNQGKPIAHHGVAAGLRASEVAGLRLDDIRVAGRRAAAEQQCVALLLLAMRLFEEFVVL